MMIGSKSYDLKTNKLYSNACGNCKRKDHQLCVRWLLWRSGRSRRRRKWRKLQHVVVVRPQFLLSIPSRKKINQFNFFFAKYRKQLTNLKFKRIIDFL